GEKAPKRAKAPHAGGPAAKHAAALRAPVPWAAIPAGGDAAFPELFGGRAAQGVAPAGPPLIRYLVIDMAGELQLELGVPVAAPVAASGRVQPGVLPEGRYAVLRHTGPYDGLMASNAALLQWARDNGVEFDTRATPQGTAWRGRAEHYLTDPAQEPDPAKLETDVAFLISEG